ncbi:MAG: pentapeptide repeat-containing protein [Prochlorothrix sp.]
MHFGNCISDALTLAPPPSRAPIGWLFHTLATQTERVEQTHWERGLDRLADVVDSLGLIRILGSIGNLALLLALLSWMTGGADRRQAQDYQAWSVISTAAAIEAEYRDVTAADGSVTQQIVVGSSGEGGRTAAIEALHNNNVNLSGLEAPGAMLVGLDLGQRGSFGQDNKDCWPWLPWGCTPNANLYAADLKGADLYGSNLKGANLKNADLSHALMSASNLQNTNLHDAIVTGVDFTGSNLQGADLHQVALQDVILVGTVLSEAQNLTDAQLDGAYLCKTQLPTGLETPRDRDCDKIAQLLVDRYGWFSTIEEAQAYLDSVPNPTEP